MNCHGCGNPIPPNGSGRPRKWCSERCRKDQYAGVCIDCGGPTDGTTPGMGIPIRCGDCAHTQPHSVERARNQRTAIQLTVAWSDADLLDALREADDLGIQTTGQYRELCGRESGWPSQATIINRLESWNRARALAGLEVHAPRRWGYSRTSAEDCARAVAEVWEACGAVPSYHVYGGFREIERPDLPSGALIRIRCGNWVAALEMAEALVRSAA